MKTKENSARNFEKREKEKKISDTSKQVEYVNKNVKVIYFTLKPV